MPPAAAGGARFVTPEAKGYARFMRSFRSPLAGLRAAAMLVALAGFSVASHASATLYKWVDADGITHYSDRPAPRAQQVHIAAAQTYKSTPAPASQPNPTRQRTSTAPAARYTPLEP